jgi:fatty-acyl-CoA synthase
MSTFKQRMQTGAILTRSNIKHFERPDRLPRAMLAMRKWGTSPAGILAASAARYPENVALIDDEGSITYEDLWARTNSVAAALADRGVGAGVGVGILCRNHRGFIEWLMAAAATGADITLLNTGFASPQLADVVEHENISILIHDNEFATIVSDCGVEQAFDEDVLNSFATSNRMVEPNNRGGRIVILTSGTTGRPKGAARRSDSSALEAVAALLQKLPFKIGDTQVVCAPAFHAWGFGNLLLGIGRCSTSIINRRFDPSATFDSLAEHRADVLVVVPVMLARMLELPSKSKLPTPNLKVIASSGSAIGSKLVLDVLKFFGPVLYNLYGSTEVSFATIATPEDLAEAPSTAGRVALAVDVEILDAAGNQLPDGRTGRVFVGASMRFQGYTSGGTKEEIRGLLSSGDLGHFRNGLLFVEGREDDMIVSGGENVFPQEVEEFLNHHPAIKDAAVVGVPDDDFGQGLAAFVVLSDELTVDEVRAHVKDHLARHKVPRQVHFVDELPRNPTGKLLRRSMIDTATGGPNDD